MDQTLAILVLLCVGFKIRTHLQYLKIIFLHFKNLHCCWMLWLI